MLNKLSPIFKVFKGQLISDHIIFFGIFFNTVKSLAYGTKNVWFPNSPDFENSLDFRTGLSSRALIWTNNCKIIWSEINWPLKTLKIGENLFSKLILHSGGIQHPWSFIETREAFKRALSLAGLVGCPTSGSSKQVMSYLL